MYKIVCGIVERTIEPVIKICSRYACYKKYSIQCDMYAYSRKRRGENRKDTEKLSATEIYLVYSLFVFAFAERCASFESTKQQTNKNSFHMHPLFVHTDE